MVPEKRRTSETRPTYESIVVLTTSATSGPVGSQRIGSRRVLARVRDAHLEALAVQVACSRKPGATKPQHQGAGAGGKRSQWLERLGHRSFNVARPSSTRITVMIQKRTMTFGSAQPVSSK